MTNTMRNTTRKSGRPPFHGNRFATPRNPHHEKKRTPIVYRIVRIFKRIRWDRVAVLFLAVLGVVHLLSLLFGAFTDKRETAEPSVNAAATVERIEYIFRDGEGTPVNMQGMTNAWASEAGYVKRYELTDAERWEVASVVSAEAEGEPYAGKVAVAQCILQACEDDLLRPSLVLEKYRYSKARPEPSEESLEAVQAVFDFGHVASDEPIKYFYAPARADGRFHESQEYVMTINFHKFFKEAEQ